MSEKFINKPETRSFNDLGLLSQNVSVSIRSNVMPKYICNMFIFSY